MESSIIASAGRPLWRYLEAHNIDADALFAQFGMEPSAIHEPRSRFPIKALHGVWSEAAKITGNEHIGLEAAKHYTPLDLNALGVTFLSSTNLREALERLTRYEEVLNSSLHITVVDCGDHLDVFSEVEAGPENSQKMMEESRHAILINLCRQGLDQGLDPVEVAFTFPEPDGIGDYFAVFRCPVLFSQPAPKISFNAEDARRPFGAANRELARNNDQVLDSIIRELHTSDLVTRVKRAIIDDLPSGTPAEEQVARQLHVSSRTLQRRLMEDGTTFRKLLLEVRCELAEQYIRDKNMPLAEISYMLGFADTSSFSRAFKRWTGDSPAAFRNSQSG